MKRRLLLWIAIITIFLLPCQDVLAASVSFTNFSITTLPYVEWPQLVAQKTKADNEQNWYMTLTSSNNLGTGRLLATSDIDDVSIELISALVPLSASQPSIVEPYYVYTGAGTLCGLYVTGDQNSAYSYHITISGRYTS